MMKFKKITKNRSQKKQYKTYAFIDSQNLNLGIQKAGWKMDWRKFRQYLKEEYGVSNAYMFIGYMQEHEDLYEYMHELGYLVVLKPTLDMNLQKDEKNQKDKPPTRGNIDADLVLYAMKELPNYDKAILVSGDGDFYGLIEYLKDNQKLLKVLAPNRQYLSVLKSFENYIERLDVKKKKLQYFDRKKPLKNKA